jgi:solute carrier family 25 uncoupling protein 8/9
MNVTRPEGDGKIKFFLKSVACASFAGCVAEIATLPLDTAKVRLQIQSKSSVVGALPKYNGFLGTMKTITAEEGMLALWKGLSAGLQR